MSDEHKGKPDPPRSFCCERVPKCAPHGNEYEKADDVKWMQFPRLYRFREYAPRSVGWSRKKEIVEVDKRKVIHNAHHCVCCGSVASELVANSEIQDVINQTSWCVNHKDNMIALPLWGHTFIWYVNQMGEPFDRRDAPQFADRPMHDCDHDRYKNEVDTELNKIATKIKKNNEHHKHRVKELKAALNSKVSYFKNEVKRRGKREGGTHTAWQKAIRDESYKDWFVPFSMANDGEEREWTFPCHEDGERRLQDKIEAWLEAIWFQQ